VLARLVPATFKGSTLFGRLFRLLSLCPVCRTASINYVPQVLSRLLFGSTLASGKRLPSLPTRSAWQGRGLGNEAADRVCGRASEAEVFPNRGVLLCCFRIY